MVLRLFGYLSLLAAVAVSAYTFVVKAHDGDLNPVREVDQAEARAELASAQYVLGIVAGQLAQVRVLDATYDADLDFSEFPLVTLVRADEDSYCLEFEKTHTFFLAGPGGTVAEGSC